MDDVICEICSALELYKSYISHGVDPDRAFHQAVSLILEDFIETALEEGYEQGYEKGYKEGCQDLTDIITAYTENLDEDTE